MRIIGSAAGGVVGGILNGASGVVRSVWGDKAAEANNQAVCIAAMPQFSTEAARAPSSRQAGSMFWSMGSTGCRGH
jgi:hypothetical protein